MDIAQFERLNEVYGPLSRRASSLCQALKEAGLPAHWEWYSNHSVLLDGEYRTEEFPIPVITVDGLCDVGLDLDGIFLEFQLFRRAAMYFDWSRLPVPFEVYGVDDYLHDFYREGMNAEGIARRIGESGEEQVGVSLNFSSDTDDDCLLAAVSDCRRWRDASQG